MGLRSLLLRPWGPLLGVPPTPGGRFEVVTDDGVRLALHRVHPEGEPGPVVMLLHGLSANRHTFNFPGRSLAAYLAGRGFDCFLPELRGAGDSARPGWHWRFDDCLRRDLPAFLATIRRVTGRQAIHWVGHSMGGLLLLCHGILTPAAPVSSGIMLGSAIDYRLGASAFRWLLPAKGLLQTMPFVPYGTLMSWLAPLAGRGVIDLAEAFSYWPENLEPAMARRLHAIGFHAIPTSLLMSLAGVLGDAGLALDDGTKVREHLGSYRIPTLVLGGSRDLQAPAAAVAHLASVLGGKPELRIFGREHGDSEEYGHFDLIVGKHAPQEVWPAISAWLEGHRSA
ncbi:MAG: alpha/beta fold hydrolase [Deltaproteobacteria bacterium]|nr:alpha/beta fold hydrolase [Deltaproteobacteria bacterium]